MNNLFFDLLRVSLDEQGCLSRTPSEAEWQIMYQIAEEQALLGICFAGVKKLEAQRQVPSMELYYQWLALATQIQQRNEMLNGQCTELCGLFQNMGYQCSILKGQGFASFYKNNSFDLSEYRQSGDIDIWVMGEPLDIVAAIKKNGYAVNQVDYRDAEVMFYDDTIVEVHFKPSILFHKSANDKLQDFYEELQDDCCKENIQGLGFNTPTTLFNLVHSMIHICGHFLSEGVGLRQLMDCYFLLIHSKLHERQDAYAVLEELGKAKMVAGIMYVLKRVFDLDENKMLCSPNEKTGKFLLNEILTGGNFGHYDTRIKHVNKKNRWAHSAVVMRRSLHFMRYMPDEVLCAPFWKLWHYCWRKRRGFL